MIAVERYIDGWGAIAHRLSQHARVEVSRDQARRYSLRTVDPLPIKRIGRFLRQRVVAEPVQVDAWAKREFVVVEGQFPSRTARAKP